MASELSIPVIWREHGSPPLAGRLDVDADGLHLDGGSRLDRRTRHLPFAAIASARIGRGDRDRIDGRPAIVLELTTGPPVSLVGFDRPGGALELLHRLETARYDTTSAGLA